MNNQWQKATFHREFSGGAAASAEDDFDELTHCLRQAVHTLPISVRFVPDVGVG